MDLPPVPQVPKPESTLHKVLRILLGGLLVTLAIAAYGGSALMLSETFVTWWLPFLYATCVAVFVTWPLLRFWHWLTRVDKKWLHWLSGMAVTVGMAMCALLLVNYCSAVKTEGAPSKAVVRALEKKTHHHTRRVGRRTYTTGTVYYTYEVTLQLPDGRSTEIGIPLDKFQSLHKGDTLGVQITTGSLGWDVIDPQKVVYPRKVKKRRHHGQPRHRGPVRK